MTPMKTTLQKYQDRLLSNNPLSDELLVQMVIAEAALEMNRLQAESNRADKKFQGELVTELKSLTNALEQLLLNLEQK